MDWLFVVVFGPLIVASLMLCREESFWRRMFSSPFAGLDREEQREVGRYLRSRETIPPDAHTAPVLRPWAEGELRRAHCLWDRIFDWALVLWITAGVVTSFLYGTVRDVAWHLIVFDLMLLAVVGQRRQRGKARAILRR